MPLEALTVAVDLGKSRCRLAAHGGGIVGTTSRSSAGTPGLATVNGVQAAEAVILSLLADLPARVDLLCVGAAGAWAAPDAAADLARVLAEATGAHAVVTSDVVSAHIGALGGGPGVLVIAGTGAAALGVDVEGVRLVDGWGPDLGDLGSGSWLGRAGIRATLAAAAGIGPETCLSATVAAHIAPSPDPVIWLAGDVAIARQLATVAPLVLDAAAAGDAVARAIATEAVRLLTASAVAASTGTTRVVLHGGLTDHAWFRAALAASMVSADRTVVPAVGDALDGALLLARRGDLAHERFVHRAG